ncbi:MAG: DUF885 domain-containing protein, partial [Candidatus Kapaibacterium sp.]
MKSFAIRFIIGLVFIVAARAGDTGAKMTLDQVFDEYHEFVLREYPESATFNGDHRYDSLWTEYSEAAYDRRRHTIQDLALRAEQVEVRELSREDLINRELFIRGMREWIESIDNQDHLLTLNQLNGLHLDLQFLADQMRLESDRDRACYLHRLRGFRQQVDGVILLMRSGMKKKIVQPALITHKVVAQLESIVAASFDKSPLYTKAVGARDVSAVEMPENTVAQVASVDVVDPLATPTVQKSPFEIDLKTVGLEVYESYRRLLMFVRDEYVPVCRKSIGLSALPQGEKRYRVRLKQHTTLVMEPDSVFATGMREVERIRTQMDRVKARLEFNGSVEEFNVFLRTSNKYYYSSREELLRGFDALLSEAKQKILPLFGRGPRADCQIKELESFRAASAPQAYYNAPPENGSKPGYFYVNTYDLPSRPMYTMTALTLHEAVPGHHLQVALAQEM